MLQQRPVLGLSGGGGSFGVVTTLWYRLYPKTKVQVLKMKVKPLIDRSKVNPIDWEIFAHYGSFVLDYVIPMTVRVLQPASLPSEWGGYYSPRSPRPKQHTTRTAN